MAQSSPSNLEAGHSLGRFELLLPIARGGMAQVWAARSPATRGFRKLVAIKTLHCEASDMRLEDMLLEEAKLASLIVHPNVVATHELGEEDGMLYLVMEWVDGLPLQTLIKATPEGTVPVPVAVQLLAQICKGLHAAHELRDEENRPLGLVHRDISPQNILVEGRGLAKIVDFGVAKATERDSGLTADGELKGKIAYMSPEQISGKPVDRRTDVFALCTLFYLLTTGVHPFRGQTVAETVHNIGNNVTLPPPSDVAKKFPRALEAILMKGLRFDADERFASARELLEALEETFPQWTHSSAEKLVADYVAQVAGPMLQERRERLERAQHEMDVVGPRSGTMRAITINSIAEEPASALLPSQALDVQALDLDSIDEMALSRRFPIKSVIAGIAVLCAVVLAQLAYLQTNAEQARTPSNEAVVTGAATARNEMLPLPEPEAARLSPNNTGATHDDSSAPSQAEARPRPRSTPPPSPQPHPPTPQRTDSLASRTPKPLKQPSVHSGSSHSPPKSPPPPSVKPSATQSPTSPSPPKEAVDAWDPNDFGDRH